MTEYVEKHEFFFDAVLNEEVSNDEVSIRRNSFFFKKKSKSKNKKKKKQTNI